MVVLFVILILVTITVPPALGLAREYHLRGAAHGLRGLIRQVRSLAAAQARYAGIVFDEVSGEPFMSVHVDGNGNGIRRAEVESGIDPRVRGPWLLTSEFPGVRYGAPPAGASDPGLPGLRIGASRILSFSPLGSSTSGSILLSNEYGLVYGVVVFGPTGRTRVGRYRLGRWEPLP
jgi:hypothetical protein